MAKRHEPGPSRNFFPTKKIKLDISVNKNRCNAVATNNLNFWGSDDDDDVILLATQQAEAQQQRQQLDDFRQIESQFTFSQFAPQGEGSSSTQRPIEPNPIKNPESKHDEDLFGDDEDFESLSSFKETQNPKDTENNVEEPAPNVTVNRRQLAQERQLEFLKQRVDMLKKENGKLQKDLLDSNNQTMTKDGEVSLLRTELQQARKLLQASKFEKLTMVEEAEKDCNSKVAEVFKQVIAKNAELSFTHVEFSEHRIRNAKNISKENRRSVVDTTDTDEYRHLLRMENLCIAPPTLKTHATHAHVYEYGKEIRLQKKQRNFLEVELEHLLFHYAQLQAQSKRDDVIIERIIGSVSGVFAELWSHAQSLEAPQHSMLHPYQHFDVQQHSNCRRNSLIQADPLYPHERAVLLRRYIATMAVICEGQSRLCRALLERKHGEYPLLQLAIEAVTKVGYSYEVSEHYGVLESTAALLHSLLDHVNASNSSTEETQLDLLFNLLKQLVFVRPSAWVFQELSSCMLLCPQEAQLMARMCSNSSSRCFLSDRVRSHYRFGPDSCLLQVYAGLLELCFCGDLALQASQFKLLLGVCGNHVRFVYQCFTVMPEFILKMLPNPTLADPDPEPETNGVTVSNVNTMASSTSSNTNNSTLAETTSQEQGGGDDSGCECYVRLCLSVVTLVFQLMYQWTVQDGTPHTSDVGHISQIAVHLLTLIFREYYLPCLFRDSEETTKHYLSLLCNWWQQHGHVLGFEDTHMRFLGQLQELQFMLKPFHQEANQNTASIGLEEWKRLVNNADRNVKKYESADGKDLLAMNTKDFFNGLKATVNEFE